MDMLGGALVAEGSPVFAKIFSDYHLERWARYWQYSSNVSLMNFVPNQALSGWLLTALVIDAIQTRKPGFPVTVAVALGLMWSPFVTVGLLPLLVSFVFTGKRPLWTGLKAQMTPANLAGLVPVAVLVAYYASLFVPIELPQRYRSPAENAFLAKFWLMTSEVPFGTFLVRYALFVACEFLVLWILLLVSQRKSSLGSDLLPLLYFSGSTLLVLPLFHYGWYNDLVMRASIPALFVLQVCTIQALRHGPRRSIVAGMIIVLAIGALYSGNLLRTHGKWILNRRSIVAILPEDRVRNLFQIQLYDPFAKNTEFVAQYVASTESLFFRRLAAASEPYAVEVRDLGSSVP
jgi:hypothetical protein